MLGLEIKVYTVTWKNIRKLRYKDITLTYKSDFNESREVYGMFYTLFSFLSSLVSICRIIDSFYFVFELLGSF